MGNDHRAREFTCRKLRFGKSRAGVSCFNLAIVSAFDVPAKAAARTPPGEMAAIPARALTAPIVAQPAQLSAKLSFCTEFAPVRSVTARIKPADSSATGCRGYSELAVRRVRAAERRSDRIHDGVGGAHGRAARLGDARPITRVLFSTSEDLT